MIPPGSRRTQPVKHTQEGVMTRRKLAALFVPLAAIAAVAVVLAATASAAPKPIVTVAWGAAEPPLTTATATAATATSASVVLPAFVISALLWGPGLPATMLPFL